ncbi:MAG: hypothetical protein ACKVSF_14630 [Alphaproteobacteria bacterium]
MRTLAFLLFMGMALAGCASGRWEHESLGFEDGMSDLRECTVHAYAESRRIEYYDPWFFRPIYARTRDGRLVAIAPDPLAYHHEKFMREVQLKSSCMRTKGYRLVPVPE